ncbi:DDE-type integrase/transposase/recombinase, partial [Shigella sonnei]|uniref:DDE-type integrase/transposase/recombinase n=1 Tax=Shigella sonnei TaxID=624 RepID=UPI000A6C6CCE
MTLSCSSTDFQSDYELEPQSASCAKSAEPDVRSTAPNQVWVADLTYVATQEGWLYLAGIKDVYTCEIVGYAMGERMTKELTGKALFMALRSQRPPAGLIHHSDRGSQYCAYDYRVIQEQSGLKTSMSRKGNC